MHIYNGIGAAPNLPDFFKARCADLTPYLSGDAAKDYPNLAAIPTYAWNNSLVRHRRQAVPVADPPLPAAARATTRTATSTTQRSARTTCRATSTTGTRMLQAAQ